MPTLRGAHVFFPIRIKRRLSRGDACVALWFSGNFPPNPEPGEASLAPTAEGRDRARLVRVRRKNPRPAKPLLKLDR